MPAVQSKVVQEGRMTVYHHRDGYSQERTGFEDIMGDKKHVKCRACSAFYSHPKIVLRSGISGHRNTKSHQDAEVDTNNLPPVLATLSSARQIPQSDPSASLSIAEEFLASDSDDEIMEEPTKNILEDATYGDGFFDDNGDEIHFSAGVIAPDKTRAHLMREMGAMEYSDHPRLGAMSSNLELELDCDESGGDSTIPDAIAALQTIMMGMCLTEDQEKS